MPCHTAIDLEIEEAFRRVYNSNWFVLGEEVKAFDIAYARLNQVNYSIGVSNGLDALYLALKASGVKKNDEVIVPSNTYIATALAVEMAGARVVFAEPDEKTYNISPKEIEKNIGPKTRCIMPVHLYGQACEMESIMNLAGRYGLKVVEDNAQAHAATFKGVKTGAFGHANATSFYPSKNVGALGEAGAITTQDDGLAYLCKVWRNYGSEKRYHNMVKGYNNRIDELQAGLLSLKLKYIGQWTQERIRLAQRYLSNLSKGPVVLPYIHPDASHVFHLFVIRTPQRDALQKYLDENGVKTVIHYPIPPHLQEAYRSSGYKPGSFPIAEELAQTSLSLPLYPGLKDEEVDYVSDLILKFYKNR